MYKLIVLFAVFGAVLGCNPPPFEMPDILSGNTIIVNTGHNNQWGSRVGEDDDSIEYKVHDLPENKVTFLEALRACWKENGTLAVLKSNNSFEKINELLRKTHKDEDRFWIGASDALQEGKWYWSLDTTSVLEPKWIENRPNTAEDNVDDCMEGVLTDGKLMMNDIGCDEKRLFICQHKIAV